MTPYDLVNMTKIDFFNSQMQAYRTNCSDKLALYFDIPEAYRVYIETQVDEMIEDASNRSLIKKNLNYVNYIKQVIDQLAGSYSGEVTRSSNDPAALEVYEKNIDNQMLKLDVYSQLLNTSLLWLQYDNKKVRYTVLSPNQIHAELDEYDQNNLQKAKAICVELHPIGSEYMTSKETVYLKYIREEDGMVHLYKVSEDLQTLEDEDEQPHPNVFRDYPFIKLDLDPSTSDFFPIGNESRVKFPVFAIILQSYITLSYKFTANPIVFTTLQNDPTKGSLKIGPGKIVYGTSPEDKFEYITPNQDYNQLAKFIIDQMKQWALTMNMPPNDFNVSSDLTSGIARIVARAPLIQYLKQRSKQCVYLEKELYQLFVRFMNDCYKELSVPLSFDESAQLEITIKPVDITTTEDQRIASVEKKLALAEKLISLGKASNLDEALLVLEQL